VVEILLFSFFLDECGVVISVRVLDYLQLGA